jgi:hypothetical protein
LELSWAVKELVERHAAEDYALACPLLEESPPWEDRRPANLSGGSASAGRYRLRKNPADGVIASAARNLALSVFKPMRDSSSPPAPRNERPSGFSAARLGRYPPSRRPPTSEWRVIAPERPVPPRKRVHVQELRYCFSGRKGT